MFLFSMNAKFTPRKNICLCLSTQATSLAKHCKTQWTHYMVDFTLRLFILNTCGLPVRHWQRKNWWSFTTCTVWVTITVTKCYKLLQQPLYSFLLGNRSPCWLPAVSSHSMPQKIGCYFPRRSQSRSSRSRSRSPPPKSQPILLSSALAPP